MQEKIIAMLNDLGFEGDGYSPLWARELAIRLIDNGWEKKS